MDDSIFHPGERLVQERTGERATALINSRNIGPHIPAAARAFVGQQRWCVVGAVDGTGSVSASLLTGEPGFVQASDDLGSLRITLDDPNERLPATAPFGDLSAGQSLAVLLIELQTRRRLRVNGHVASVSPDFLEVAVGQAFPVCPRYIQKRQPEALPPGADALPAAAASGTEVSAEVADWIDACDTLFIASIGPTGEADVSHRGGRAGFVQRQGQVLRIPDYNGNSMFNTLGNLALEPRCGLVLPDFGGTRQLQLTGTARACFDVAEDLERTGGTGRWIEFTVDSWRTTPLNLPLRWSFVEASRFNP